MKLIIGLGNLGDYYKNTRHNLGFAVLDKLMKKMDDGKWKVGAEDGRWRLDKKFKSEILQLNYTLDANSYTLLLARPQTYMNNSGEAVTFLADYYKIPVGNIIVIHDDVDIVLGKIKVRIGGSGGGHHGVESIIKSLGDDKFIRVRLGIGEMRETGGKERNIEKFVLEPFLSSERSKVKQMIKHAVEAVELILRKGLGQAQNQYN